MFDFGRDRLRDCEGSGTRAKPLQLDEFFSIGAAPVRATGFAALEWTEATVWNTEENAPT